MTQRQRIDADFFLFCLIITGYLLAGCTPEIPTPTVATPVVAVPITTARFTATPTERPVEPTGTPTATSSPSPIISPATPTATLEPTPAATLAARNPSLAELESYLAAVPVRFFSWNSGHSTISLADLFAERDLTQNARFFFEDVNGDGEADLIVSDLQPPIGDGLGYLFVLLWQGNQYGEPFMMADGAKYQPNQRVSFEDWTGEGVPEVIFDFHSDIGGVGIVEVTLRRYVIHCQQICQVVWWAVTEKFVRFYSVGLTTTTIDRLLDEQGRPTIQRTSETFFVPALDRNVHYMPPMSDLDYYNPESLKVYTSTLELFTWNEATFDLTKQQILSEPYIIESQAVLTATHPSGDVATITAEFNDDDIYRPIYKCTIHINETAMYEPFDCHRDFTQIEWRDMNQDGHEELVARALVFDSQRLLAFQWDRVTLSPLADVTGDIIRSDLYGVRLEDLDGDGLLEIIAGERRYVSSDCVIYESPYYPEGSREVCWSEPAFRDQVYRWNGRSYVLQEE